LESPHNAIHLAVGGFYQEGVYNASPIRGANGDMGDNETAGFDPIFFFHHCFIDYTFSVWQRLWNCEKRGDLTLIQGYPGTILTEGQPPNFPVGTQIRMTTPLYPFKKPNGEDYTSDDATDLNELGIAYGLGSLDPLIGVEPARSGKHPFEIINPQLPNPMTLAGGNPNVANPFSHIKWVHNISRTQYEGSFVIRLYARGHDGKEVEVGREPILSRWNVKDCANCQNHLDVDLYVPIDAATMKLLEGPADRTGKKAEIEWLVKVHARDGLHDFPILAPGPDRGGAPVERPKIDDL
jgi:tyrosinase